MILDLLGQGTFGQVVKCQNVRNNELVAVKVIKNQPAYFNQSMMEVTVLELLNGKHDPADAHHIVRMKDTFIFRQHLCVVVELLSLNLYELIKQNQYRGFSLQLCRVFLAQILDAMRVLKEAKIIHCDLKPENILLRNLDSPGIKVIDYGSACHEQQTLYTYIQSRFYRSPEVLLGLPYSAAIDIWSLGCIAAELFLGLPLFPGASNYDQVGRIVETLGIPPTHMLEVGRDAALYFDKRPDAGGQPRYLLKSRERYSLETGKAEAPSKKYFATADLEELVLSYPIRPKDMPAAERENELRQRRLFVDFLRGLLKMNPVERCHPQQALQHPFITGKATPVLGPLAASLPAPPRLAPKQPLPKQQPVAMRQRPRANTLSSLSLQDVPPQIHKIGVASREAGHMRPTGRPPPDAVFPSSDVEPPALPFEVGSVPKQPSQLQEDGKTAQRGKPPTNYYVDRLAGFSGGRRVSNPPSMGAVGGLAIRGSRRLGSRADSLDDFAPSSLPQGLGDTLLPDAAWSPPSSSHAQQQQPRKSARRMSEPALQPMGLAAGSAVPPVRRRGSLASASGPSALSRSLTLGEMEHRPADTRSPSITTSQGSSSAYMDTLEEEEEDSSALPSPAGSDGDQMDID